MKLAKVFSVVCLVAIFSTSTHAQRLPGESLPHAYRVSITPYLDEELNSFTFDGYSSIWVEVLRTTSSITLHADLTVRTVSVSTSDGVAIQSTFQQLQDDSKFLVINLEEEVSAGDYLTLNILFSGEINNDVFGFYRSSYEEDGQTKYLGVTKFEQDGARMAMPCYDEPAIKATFQFSFRPLQGYEVLFNTPQMLATDDADGRRTVAFQQTPVMSAYLLAWVVSQLQGVPSPLDPTTVVWTTRDTAAQAEYASRVAPATVSAMEQLVGVPYARGNLTKMGHVAVPDFPSSAMENWGLIIYKQPYLLALENVSSESTKQSVLGVMQHEVAHQWFGNLVSPNWWTVLWLAEGFATFFQSFATALIEPTWRFEEEFVVSTLMSTAMLFDGYSNSQPLTGGYNDGNEYYKGASVLRMILCFMGEEPFYKGLHNYLIQNEYSNATDDVLFAALDEVSDPSTLPPNGSVSSVMLPWARQAGYPVLTVTRNYSDGSATITQSRWLLPANPGDQRTWTVPVTFTSAAEADFSAATRLWLSQRTVALDSVAGAAADQWVLFNLQVTGFYRVLYDADNWALLIAELLSNPDAIPPVNRAMLLEDASAFVMGGQMEADTLLQLTTYLANEMDYIPWTRVQYVTDYLSTILDDDELDALTQYIVERVTSKLGFEPRPGDSHTTRVFRSLVWGLACSHNQPACRQAAYERFQRFMADPSDRVDPDMKSIVYCEGVRQGGDQAYNFLQELYEATNVISEQSTIRTALGCQERREAVRQLLETVFSGAGSSIQRRHLPNLLQEFLEKPRSHAGTAALEFLVDNPQVLLSDDMDKKNIRRLLMPFTLVACDAELLDKVKELGHNIGDQLLASAASSQRLDHSRCSALRLSASNWVHRWNSRINED